MSMNRRRLIAATLAASVIAPTVVAAADRQDTNKELPMTSFDNSRIEHPGATGFDVEDRLAILNLLQSYASGYDADDFDRWRMQFINDPVCTIYNAGNETIRLTGDDFYKAFEGFRSIATQQNVQPLHYSSNLMVKEQNEQTAVAEIYMLYIPFNQDAQDNSGIHPGALSITGTSRYRFQLIKGDDNAWRIAEYLISFDPVNVRNL